VDEVEVLPIIGFLSLLIVASFVAIAVKYIKIPYTIALVIVGLVLAVLLHFLDVDLASTFHITIDRNLIFVFLLPPLLFEGALSMNLNHLKENIGVITTLAIPGVLVSTFIVGGLIHVLTGLPLMESLLFGALISPTDPVSVLALFKKMGAPKRLSTIVEGESLFNDGTGVVIFGIILIMIERGGTPGPLMLVGEGIGSFILVAGSGLAVGVFFGFMAYKFLAHIDDHLIEVTITFVLAYGVFIFAELVNGAVGHEVVSGVLAVVAAGLIMGNYGRSFSMTASTRVALKTFWDFMTFIVNSVLFLLMGITIDLLTLPDHFVAIIFAIVVVIVARAAVVYINIPVLNRWKKQKISSKWQHIMFWGGLRGAIPIALLLYLTSIHEISAGNLDMLLHMGFGFVVFSLVVQGLTIEPLLKHLGMSKKAESQLDYEKKIGQAMASRAAAKEIEKMVESNEIPKDVCDKLKEEYSEKIEELSTEIRELIKEKEELKSKQERNARKQMLLAEKSAIQKAYRKGIISESVCKELLTDINVQLDLLEW
jgi:CPA1 family monovalent cation:H+ antiporter